MDVLYPGTPQQAKSVGTYMIHNDSKQHKLAIGKLPSRNQEYFSNDIMITMSIAKLLLYPLMAGRK